MKKITLFTLLLSFAFVLNAQSTYTINSGNWSVAGNWTCSGACPTGNAPPNILPAGDIIENTGSSFIDGLNIIISSGAFLNVSAGTLTINNMASLTNVGITDITSGATLTNNNDFTNNGMLTNAGTLNAATGGIPPNQDIFTNTGIVTNTGLLRIARTFNNNGTLTNSSTIVVTNTSIYAVLNNSGMLTNEAAGTIDNNNIINNSGTFTNEGTIDNGNGVGDVFTNTGTLIINGNINNTGGGNNLDNTGGTITGTGTISGNFTNAGTIAPGGTNPIGSLTIIGDFTNNGTLNIEITGSPASNDMLIVNGNLILNGTLNFLLIGPGAVTTGSMYTPIIPTGTITLSPLLVVTYPGNAADWSNVGFTFTYNGAPLPIDLLTFDGKRVGETIELLWITATETNNALMEIERSRDGIKFEKIGEKKAYGDGNSQVLQTYKFTDVEPLPGVNYYRLRQWDKDGKAEYHRIISKLFTNEKGDDIKVFPTLVQQELNIVWSKETERGGDLRIHNVAGQLVWRGSFERGMQQRTLPMQALPQGQYVITIQTGSLVQTARFVKL